MFHSCSRRLFRFRLFQISPWFICGASIFQYLSPHSMLLTLLILAWSRPHVIYETNKCPNSSRGRPHTGNQMIGSERVALAIFISFPASASGTTVLLKTPANLNYNRNKYATKNYTNVYHSCKVWYNGSYTTLAKPIKTLENALPSSVQFFKIFSVPSSWNNEQSIIYIYRPSLKFKSSNLLRTVSK